jgi:hypothetical protein
VRKRWLDRLYRGWILLLQRFHDDWVGGKIDRNRVYVVRYDRMMENLENVMEEMCAFLDHPMTPELRATIEATAHEQRSYKSEHRYNLAKFGLSEAQIRKDCAFYYETFLSEPHLMAAQGSAE